MIIMIMKKIHNNVKRGRLLFLSRKPFDTTVLVCHWSSLMDCVCLSVDSVCVYLMLCDSDWDTNTVLCLTFCAFWPCGAAAPWSWWSLWAGAWPCEYDMSTCYPNIFVIMTFSLYFPCLIQSLYNQHQHYQSLEQLEPPFLYTYTLLSCYVSKLCFVCFILGSIAWYISLYPDM